MPAPSSALTLGQYKALYWLAQGPLAGRQMGVYPRANVRQSLLARGYVRTWIDAATRHAMLAITDAGRAAMRADDAREGRTSLAAPCPQNKATPVTELKAYVVENVGDDERRGSYVVFGRSARVVLRGAWIDDARFIDVRARRTPEWDRYAPGPVPFRVRLDAGWWADCGGYGRTLRFPGEHPEMVVDDSLEQAWCDARCRARDEGWTRGRVFAIAERMAASTHTKGLDP